MARTPKKDPKRFRTHSTPRLRNRVWVRFECGMPAAEIAEKEGILESLVYGIRKRFRAQDWGVSRPGRGRRGILSDRDKRHLMVAVGRDPFISIPILRRDVVPHVSVPTVRRFLRNAGIMHRRAARRPFLTKEHARKRLQWARAMQDKSVEYWKNVLFTDESSVQRGQGQHQKWVFRPLGTHAALIFPLFQS
ncbi:hypothetical protein PFICI_11448 [Pestalotiopsis fici W106-1]|uniref:Transposase Tc1-like domain-containing protein n=1 Tax=Pestalotiopsis fici (strain W106-1 / CGMCC3.15140) TaxID=1229662 RepID=W3WUT5_PESFW|nr:uncharacterized protein PFICI_11448 [Pestalotiopsis fici W106-1]ETS77574.1 hypothetical protein PFICI_11448 [Pestalotiopsis fici W106-1]